MHDSSRSEKFGKENPELMRLVDKHLFLQRLKMNNEPYLLVDESFQLLVLLGRCIVTIDGLDNFLDIFPDRFTETKKGIDKLKADIQTTLTQIGKQPQK